MKRKATEKPLSKKAEKSSFTVEGVVITHPGREVYPGTGITKGDIAQYYARAVPFILPFIEGRLVSLLRCTDGIAGQCFFQRNLVKGMGPEIYGKMLAHNGKKHNYLYIESAKGLIGLAQMGVIEFHPWQSRVENVLKPDQIIFDLDPGEGVPFEAVKLAAEDVRRRLKKIKIESFARLSGGKGIHVAFAIAPRHSFSAVKSFAQDFARQMAQDMPETYIENISKGRRCGKIFIDYLRNDYAATAIAPFSLRARKNAPVAVPISWKELDTARLADAFRFSNIDKKMNRAAEKLIKSFFDLQQDLPR